MRIQLFIISATRQSPSLFTHFLIKGLSGKADYTNDGVITLSELLIYVRYEVTKKASLRGASQTPMLGRIEGEGEMIFFNKEQK